MIRQLISLWKMRDTPYAHMCELNSLLVKAGQRCAYDMRHASDEIRGEMSEHYHHRARLWLSVFDAGDNGKNYRHRLHHDIMDLELQIDRLEKLCEKHGIDHSDPNGIPF